MLTNYLSGFVVLFTLIKVDLKTGADAVDDVLVHVPQPTTADDLETLRSSDVGSHLSSVLL